VRMRTTSQDVKKISKYANQIPRLLYALLTSCRTTNDAVDAYSKAESQVLAAAINQKLPRELRDMIYGFYWEDHLQQYDHYENKRPWRTSRPPPDPPERRDDAESDSDVSECSVNKHARLLYENRPECHRSFSGGHIVSTDYMGREAAQEAAEAFYRTAPAYVETLDDSPLAAYFGNDTFRMNLTPRDYITSITIFLDRACSKQPHARRLDSEEKVSFLSLSGSGLSTLFGNSRKVLPSIVFLIKDEYEFAVTNTLEVSLPLYGQLKALGVHITVLYIQSPLLYRVKVVTPVNLGAIMEMPRQTWEKHFVDECQKQNPERVVPL
jgi:hypothetical protein